MNNADGLIFEDGPVRVTDRQVVWPGGAITVSSVASVRVARQQGWAWLAHLAFAALAFGAAGYVVADGCDPDGASRMRPYSSFIILAGILMFAIAKYGSGPRFVVFLNVNGAETPLVWYPDAPAANRVVAAVSEALSRAASRT